MFADQLRRIKGSLARVVPVIFAALMLPACVQSQTPLLAESMPLVGEQFSLHLYEEFVDGKASSLKRSVFRWDGTHYALVSGDPYGVKSLVARPLDANDLVIQVSDEKVYMYLLGRKLADGVYRIIPIDRKDIDEAARDKMCVARSLEICTIETREQLDLFARAAAVKPPGYTMIAVIASVDAR